MFKIVKEVMDEIVKFTTIVPILDTNVRGYVNYCTCSDECDSSCLGSCYASCWQGAAQPSK